MVPTSKVVSACTAHLGGGRAHRERALARRRGATTNSTSSSGFDVTAISRSSQVEIVAAVDAHHLVARLHAAAPAAESACTTPITAGRLRNASTRSPCISTTASSSTARIMFMAGPAIRIWKRCHLRLRQELVGGALRLVLGVLAGHLHVAAERNRAQAVLGVAALERQQLGAEAQREGEHADAVPAGQQEVPQLVHEHEHAEHESQTPAASSSIDPLLALSFIRPSPHR